MDHIKNNCTLGFLLDHWIIGSLDHIPEGSLVQVTWSISGAGVPIMNQKNWAKCPNQTNKLGFSITSPTPFFQSQPHGRDLEKIPLNSLDGTVGSPLGTLFSRKMVMTARNCGSTCFWKMKYMTSNPKTKNKSSCSIQTKTTESTAGGIPSTCKLSIGEKKTQNLWTWRVEEHLCSGSGCECPPSVGEGFFWASVWQLQTKKEEHHVYAVNSRYSRCHWHQKQTSSKQTLWHATKKIYKLTTVHCTFL